MSEVRVNKLSPRSGTTVTLGDSGDTITIPSGVTLANSGTFTNFQSTGIDDNATSTAITINSSEYVGVGTSNPTTLLHLKANAPYITFEDDDNNQDWQIQATAWFAFRNQTTNSELMRIDSSGNVGIGTSSPSAKLEISASTPDIQLTDSDGTNQFATIKQDGSNLKILSRNNTGSGGIVLKRNVGGTETDAFQIQSNGDISFYDSTGASQDLFWDASAERLGIGTTSPVTPLNVIGGSDLGIEVSDTSGNGVITIKGNATTGGSYLQFGDTDDDNVGRIYYTHNDNAMKFNTSDAERMRIDSSGRVGIGITSLTYPLEVNGIIKASNFTTLKTQLVMSNSSQDWDISSVIGTIPNVEGSISFELTMRERSTTTNQLFRIFYIRVGPGTTFNISSAIWSVGSTAANTTISYPSAGTIRFTNSSFSVLDAQIRRISG
jgi:hypothetical protein